MSSTLTKRPRLTWRNVLIAVLVIALFAALGAWQDAHASRFPTTKHSAPAVVHHVTLLTSQPSTGFIGPQCGRTHTEWFVVNWKDCDELVKTATTRAIGNWVRDHANLANNTIVASITALCLFAGGPALAGLCNVIGSAYVGEWIDSWISAAALNRCMDAVWKYTWVSGFLGTITPPWPKHLAFGQTSPGGATCV